LGEKKRGKDKGRRMWERDRERREEERRSRKES
jgi:hypothetical protein